MSESFQIYNASAGSGKTFTLVKEYLKILLVSKNNHKFKHVLAITFTNKAVGEMKSRVIEMLKLFSEPEILAKPNSMFRVLTEELEISEMKLHKRSKVILETIIHNYASFDISTIDGFTHKLIRTFAYDLRLPLNFEVELDVETLLNEAVDSVIAKAGTDKALTKVLVDFAIEKANNDKSWDVSYDFKDIAKLLVNENDLPYIKQLQSKTLNDFRDFKTYLNTTVKTIETDIINNAKKALQLINDNGLDYEAFSRKSLPNFFKKLTELNFTVTLENKWQTDLVEGNIIYTKSKVTPANADIIESIQPQLADYFINCKQLLYTYKLYYALLKKITPLSVLNAIQNELNAIKEDENKMLISEFNSLISNEIKDQPTPFIYERLGEKFKHYFIDEFQDTSEMQWQNLVPLIGNALEQQNFQDEQGSLMIVGDAKQAIYRWRGGKAEQFIDLYSEKSKPFFIDQSVKDLEFNYRSAKQVIEFNNLFFKFLSQTAFSHPEYQDLYKKSKQNTFLEAEGYVSINLLEIDKDDDKNERYPEAVLKTINYCQNNGFKLGDICILTRTRLQGVTIANYLSEHDVNVISSESLLLANSPEVNLINSVLQLLITPNEEDIKFLVLQFLADNLKITEKHQLFSRYVKLKDEAFFKALIDIGVNFSALSTLQQPLFDAVETIIRSFNLAKTPNAYIQYYLDEVLNYSQKHNADISGFLNYFNDKKDKLSIVSPKTDDAVEVMTIHKSKGLEFPVVIFPYAEVDIYREQDARVWFNLDADEFKGFPVSLINYNKDIAHFGKQGEQLYNQHQSELELDNINVLYVALTRPVEQLHIIGKNEESTKTFSGLFINYLKSIGVYNDTENFYEFGNPKKEIDSTPAMQTLLQPEFISTDKKTHNISIVTKAGALWNTKQQEAIERGNLIHDIMALVFTKTDIDFAINDFVSNSKITLKQAKSLKKSIEIIVNHPKLSAYFQEDYKIFNERDILTPTGKILRPDRLILQDNKAIIIDYKTGKHDNKYINQLSEYQDFIEKMSYKVKSKILVYINENIEVITC